MLASLGAGLGSKLAERWATVVVSPAFAFWGGGIVALASSGGEDRWRAIERWIDSRAGSVQIALAVGALLAVVCSGLAVERLTLPVLRTLEGYWPPFAEPLRRLLVRGWERRMERQEERHQALIARRDAGAASAPDLRRLAELELRLRRLPADPAALMPTALGNRLRAAERRPFEKYGLDAVTCWPHMWLLLPDQARGDIGEAQSELGAAAVFWTWGALFVVWTPWAWWAPLAALTACGGSWAAMLRAAELLGTLVDAAFDLYRGELYRALRWPLPSDPAAEQRSGPELTKYLWRGSDAPAPRFTGTDANV